MQISRERILYRDDSILAVNKLAGELTVRGSGKLQKLPLLDFLKKEFPGIHPLNRLDFETSGAVLFARNKKILADILSTKFKGWKKTYRTIVTGRLKNPQGEITLPLPTRSGVRGNIPALTKYLVVERFKNATYVKAEIETGRHHQIRRHFSMIGHPLALDDLYGDEKTNKKLARRLGYRRFFLHAWKVTFPHPVTGKEIVIEASMPKPFEEVLKLLHEAS